MTYGLNLYKAVTTTGGAAVSPDCSIGRLFQVEVDDNSAFTINLPTNATKGMRVTFEIYNNSGGAIGTITWASGYQLARGFVNPANGTVQMISFDYDGTNWNETGRGEKGTGVTLTQTYSTADATLATPTAAALTASTGTADGTVDDVGGAFNQTTLNNNFKECADQINKLRADLLDLAQFVNSLVDGLQAAKLVG